MAYIEERWECGDVIEVEKFHSFRYGRKFCRRDKNHTPTTEQQRKINDRQAEKKLRRQMKANFDENDLYVTLTFKPSMRPTPEEMKEKRILQNFLRRMKKYYVDGKEMKYIYVVEYKERTIHIHLVITGTHPKNIRKEWKQYGGTHMDPMYEDKDFDGLAEYLVKESKKNLKDDDDTVTRRRWVASRNLVTPEAEKKVLPYKDWRAEPKEPKGYRLVKDSLVNGFHDVTGYKFQRYTLQKIPGYKKPKKKRQKSRKKETNVTQKPKNGKQGNGIRAGDQ